MADEPKKFWMIIRGDGEGHSTMKRHYDYGQAREEAERLCRKEGLPFYLLEARERIFILETPIKWQRTVPYGYQV